tara:strand:+ start:30 stop:542 length:513 start_codon:yes stop_codon:yes gene_type:complete
MNKEFLPFNLNFDRAKLLRLWHEKYKSKARSWGKDYDADTLKRVTKSKSSEGDRDVFKVSKVDLEEYPQTLMELFGIKAKPRFFFLKANTVLPYHVDPDLTCGINFILSGKPAPVSFEQSGNTYEYKTALLNTSLPHGVWNGSEDRILFKLSIVDEPYEVVYNNIMDLMG